MSGVSYFQHYSQRENHATNNTLLLIRHFYQKSPRKAEEALSALVGTGLSVGLTFRQQIRKSQSVPDGLISQKAFEIYFETKRNGDLDKAQINAHLVSIAEAKDSATQIVLFGLTRTAISEDDKVLLSESAQAVGVMFVPITFAEIDEEFSAVLNDHDYELRDILHDYREYLLKEDLLRIGDVLTVFPCGISLKQNRECRLYFEGAQRPTRAQSDLIGLYSNKCVRYVGKPTTIATGLYENGAFRTIRTEVGRMSPAQLIQLDEAISAFSYWPGFATEELRYYLFDELHETSIRKVSKGGIWGARVFNLVDLVGPNARGKSFSAKEAADHLRSATFT